MRAELNCLFKNKQMDTVGGRSWMYKMGRQVCKEVYHIRDLRRDYHRFVT